MGKRRKTPGAPFATACGRCAYRDLLNSAPDGMVVIGNDGVVRFSNPSASALLGASLSPGCQVGDREGWSGSPFATSPTVDAARLIRLGSAGGGDRAIEVRTARMRWAGEASLLLCLHAPPRRPEGAGKRWSILHAVYRGLRASAPVCGECGSPRIDGNGTPEVLARAAGLVGHRCQDCLAVFFLPRRLALEAGTLARHRVAQAEEPLGVERLPDPVPADALQALDQLLEALPKAKQAPKADEP